MLFSVIVPVYNVEQYLRECVDSILNQSFTDFELILVDDGSKDSSGAICDEYAEKDSRVKVIHKENGGQSTARNRGIDEAQGQYAVFLDSDDFIAYSDFFSDLSLEIEENTDVVVFRYHKYYSNHIESEGASIGDLQGKDTLTILKELVKRDAFFCSCWSKTVKMDILKDHNIRFDERLSCEDMDWYYNVLQYARNFKILDNECISYRQRENSVTSVFKRKSILDYIFTLDKWSEIINKMSDEEIKYVYLSSLAKLYCNLLISYSRNSKKLKEEKEKIFSFKYLLAYNLNPRTNIFYKLSKYLGLNLTCLLLNIVDKVR